MLAVAGSEGAVMPDESPQTPRHDQPDRRLHACDRRTVARGGRRATDHHEEERLWRSEQMATFLGQAPSNAR